MDKKTKIALGIGAAGVLGYLILSGSGERGGFDGGGGGGGFEPLLEPKKVTTTSTSEDPGRTTNIYNLGGEDRADPNKFFAVPQVIERIIEVGPQVTSHPLTGVGGGFTIDPTLTKKEAAVDPFVQRGGGVGHDFARAESIPYSTTKKEAIADPYVQRAGGIGHDFARAESISYPSSTTTTKKSSTISTIKSVAIAAVTMSQPISFAKSVSSFISSWWR